MDLDPAVSSDDGEQTEDKAFAADGEQVEDDAVAADSARIEDDAVVDEGERAVDRDETEEERLWDVGYDDSNVYEYECLDCGVIVVAESHPTGCPTCDAAMRNRAMPIE